MSLDVHLIDDGRELYGATITHNLVQMANAAGIYEALWNPEEIGAVKASDIIGQLEVGLALLITTPTYFEQFDSPNGWGTWRHFVPFVSKYLEACREYPDASIEVDR